MMGLKEEALSMGHMIGLQEEEVLDRENIMGLLKEEFVEIRWRHSTPRLQVLQQEEEAGAGGVNREQDEELGRMQGA